MLVLASPHPSVWTSVTNFSWNLFFFSDILHSNRNLETEKRIRSGFSRKKFLWSKIGKKDSKWVQNGVNQLKGPQTGLQWSFYDFSKKFSESFRWRNQKWKILKLSVFLCKHHIWVGKFSFTSYRPKCHRPIRLQDSLIIHISGSNACEYYITFFALKHRDIHQGTAAFGINNFGWVCPGMSIHIQACLDLPGVLLVSLGAFAAKR